MKKLDRNQAHYIVVTVILVNSEGKFLIAKRADWEKAFPGRWTVPGGKLEVLDYALKKKDTAHHWYNVFEDVGKREVLEEVGITVNAVDYVTSMVYVRPDNIPCTIVSLFSHTDCEQVNLCNALTEHKWVTLSEAKEFDLIEGIYEELEMLERKLHSGESGVWEKK